MLRAFALAVGQLGDRAILAVLARTILLTVSVFAAIGLALWGALERLLPSALDGYGWIVAVFAVVLLGWLLFRLVAVAVLQMFGDEVVAAVEARHYPGAARRARRLGLGEEAGVALAGLGRALGYNLAALPVALLLLATGAGAALVFAVVNAVLLGRELTEMVALRHRAPDGTTRLPPLGIRTALGGVVVLLLTIPIVNLVAPVLGAAAATHLVHARLGRGENAHV